MVAGGGGATDGGGTRRFCMQSIVWQPAHLITDPLGSRSRIPHQLVEEIAAARVEEIAAARGAEAGEQALAMALQHVAILVRIIGPQIGVAKGVFIAQGSSFAGKSMYVHERLRPKSHG